MTNHFFARIELAGTGIEALDRIKANRGMVTHLEEVMAIAPSLLAAYTNVMDLCARGPLDPIAMQLLLHTVSTENECDYCVAWHRALLQRAGVDSADLDRINQGLALADRRLQSLRRFTLALMRQRGHVGATELEEFLAAGWTQEAALHVIVGIAAKTLSNYASSLTQVKLEPAMAKYAADSATEKTNVGT